MEKQSLIYSFIARGMVILSEFIEFTGNFTSIASQFLHKLPSTNNKFTYTCDGHTFNYLVQDGFTYIHALPLVREAYYNEREAEEQAERERLRKQWIHEQEHIKNEPFQITYSYYDGASHRRVLQVKMVVNEWV